MDAIQNVLIVVLFLWTAILRRRVHRLQRDHEYQ